MDRNQEEYAKRTGNQAIQADPPQDEWIHGQPVDFRLRAEVGAAREEASNLKAELSKKEARELLTYPKSVPS